MPKIYVEDLVIDEDELADYLKEISKYAGATIHHIETGYNQTQIRLSVSYQIEDLFYDVAIKLKENFPIDNNTKIIDLLLWVDQSDMNWELPINDRDEISWSMALYSFCMWINGLD